MTAVGSPLAGRLKARTPVPARETAKGLLRTGAVLTSPLRPLPDFIIIGAKRCGTTSLHNWLLQHPGVAPIVPASQGRKGVHYFDRSYTRSTWWYRSHFPLQLPGRPHRVCGEASPYYLVHPQAPERVAAVAPGVRLIVLLRDPAERAYSQYRDEVKLGHETLSFADALAAELERMAPELQRLAADPAYYSHRHEHLSYAAQSSYADNLRRWLAHFDRDQFCVLTSEAMFADPAAAYHRVTEFLGLPAYRPPAFGRFNASPPLPADPTVAALRRQLAPQVAALPELVGLQPTWTAAA